MIKDNLNHKKIISKLCAFPLFVISYERLDQGTLLTTFFIYVWIVSWLYYANIFV